MTQLDWTKPFWIRTWPSENSEGYQIIHIPMLLAHIYVNITFISFRLLNKTKRCKTFIVNYINFHFSAVKKHSNVQFCVISHQLQNRSSDQKILDLAHLAQALVLYRLHFFRLSAFSFCKRLPTYRRCRTEDNRTEDKHKLDTIPYSQGQPSNCACVCVTAYDL